MGKYYISVVLFTSSSLATDRRYCIGPFDSKDDADQYADTQLPSFDGCATVREMLAPTDTDFIALILSEKRSASDA